MQGRFPLHDDEAAQRRHNWRAVREVREAAFSGRTGRLSPRQYAFSRLRRLRTPLKSTRIFRHLAGRAIDLTLTELEISFPDLPPAFDGYRILHLSDLHLDHIDDTAIAAARRVIGIAVDLCVITGDFRDSTRAPLTPLLEDLEMIVSAVRAVDGVVGVLGNHDSAAMVGPIEALGVRLLLNETITLTRHSDRVHLTGLDDVHAFRTEQADITLEETPEGFAIALVHSPEIADRAAHRHRLYLTGHTHGGQICLPGGRPLITSLRRPFRRLARGVWRHGRMVGYTSRGIGAAGLPVRVHCQAEVTLITLRQNGSRVMLNGNDVELGTF